MFNLRAAVLSMCGVFSIAGCAALTAERATQAWRIQPSFGVQHGVSGAKQTYRLGRYYQGQMRYEQAIAAYRETLALDPTFADAHSALGVIHAEQERYDEAIVEFRTAIALAPGVAYLHSNLGYLYLMRGSNEDAVKVLEEARRLDPRSETALHNLRLGYERLGEMQEKARRLEEAVERAGAPAAEVQPIAAGAEIRTTANSGVELVAIAPNVYELQTPVSTALPGTLSPPGVPATDRERETLGQGDARLKPFKLEVANGNGVTGMAKRVARYLELRGVASGRLTNQTPFNQADTQVQYRVGYGVEATLLSTLLPRQFAVVQSDTLRSDIQVRVVLGKDVRADTASFEPAALNDQLAANLDGNVGSATR
jgi:Flp pilus assembly protein TadD